VKRELRILARASRSEHDLMFRQGTPPTIEDLVGWEFEGLNCSLAHTPRTPVSTRRDCFATSS
jgi:hypothetical protein